MELRHREDKPSLDASDAVLSCASEKPHRRFERVALLAAAIVGALALVFSQLLGVRYRKRRTVVGLTGLALTDYILRHATVGIELQPEYWNQGIGTEAVTAVIEFARQYTNFTKIEAGCFSDNIACSKALTKAGMLTTGTNKEFWIKNGKWLASNHFTLSLAPSSQIKSVE